MRRLAVLAFAALILLAIPAGAKTSPAPTARQLVKKLIAAKVCTGPPIAVDPSETIAKCQFIEIHAFATKTKALKALDIDLAADCVQFPHGLHPYRVGTTWWTHTYGEPYLTGIANVLGGKIKSYPCP